MIPPYLISIILLLIATAAESPPKTGIISCFSCQICRFPPHTPNFAWRSHHQQLQDRNLLQVWDFFWRGGRYCWVLSAWTSPLVLGTVSPLVCTWLLQILTRLHFMLMTNSSTNDMLRYFLSNNTIILECEKNVETEHLQEEHDMKG